MSSVLLDTSVDCHRSDVDCLTQLRKELNAILKGKPDVIELVLVCLLSRGHLLIEDKPGLGKTTLAKGLADALGGAVREIAVYAGPVAQRYHGVQSVQSEEP